MHRLPVAPLAIIAGSAVVHTPASTFDMLVSFDHVVPPSLLNMSMDLILNGPLRYPDHSVLPSLPDRSDPLIHRDIRRCVATREPDVRRASECIQCLHQVPGVYIEDRYEARRILRAPKELAEDRVLPAHASEG